MAGREWCRGCTAFNKTSELRLVGSAEAIDEFGQRPAIIAHLEAPVSERFCLSSPAVCFDQNVEGLLIEAAYVNLPFLPEHHRFDTVAGDVIAADLDLPDHIAIEP